jgi:methylenetetrahydrofolate dehydrogenase (NADP+)/methenyltetrahydrofolate cyclohydrolase
MTAQIIDGRKIAEQLKVTVESEAAQLVAAGGCSGLAILSVGPTGSADAYRRRLVRMAVELGVPHREHTLPATTTQDELIALVGKLNTDRDISGILILRPLPGHIDEVRVYRELNPHKDVEAVHPENVGLLTLGAPRYIPSTAAAVYHVLDSWLDNIGEDRVAFYRRSRIVVVGRSNNVGKPAIALAYAREAAAESVDKWASVGNQLGLHTRRADVLVVAAGVPGLIRSEHIRSGAVVLDVGINIIDDAGTPRMVGDVLFPDVVGRARALTPVPGGIGPVTDVWLLRNVIAAGHIIRSESAAS